MVLSRYTANEIQGGVLGRGGQVKSCGVDEDVERSEQERGRGGNKLK